MMDAKALNAAVHDREAAFYDERFAIAFDGRLASTVRRDLEGVAGPITPVARALDYCCGTGFAAVGIAAAGLASQVHACDLSPKMIDQAAANARTVGVGIVATVSDGERLPYADGAFELIVARGALHHLPDPVAALNEVRRVLAPGGRVIVLAEPTPSGESQVAAVVGTLARVVATMRRALRRPVDEEHHNWELASMAANLHTFTQADIKRLASAAGFREVSTSAAWWAWVLVLGLNYYAAGESRLIASHPVLRTIRFAMVDAANVFDRYAGRLVPARFRHTVQAVLR